MSAPAGVKFGGAFWERIWRLSGVGFIIFIVAGMAISGLQPPVGASADTMAAFFVGHRTRILIAAVVSGFAVLNLLWFVAALRAALAQAGRDGWGGAATMAGAAFAIMILVPTTLSASLALTIAGRDAALASSLNDLAWAGFVLGSFPRAMLIMAGSFGLWRAGLISNALFAGGVAAIVLTLAGGTTWLSGGAWAPDGVYSQFIVHIIGFVWILVVTRVLLTRSPAGQASW
jgi:hypothetical protein